MNFKRLLGAIGLCAVLISSSGLHASGFAIQEQSQKAQGYSFAGASSAAEDISYMHFNPAAITKSCGTNVVMGAAFVIPSGEAKNGVATPNVAFGPGGANLPGYGAAYTGKTSQDAFAKDAIVPSFYASQQFCNDFWVALAVTSPFGLVTDYSNDWIGRYHATRSELFTLNIAPTIGWRPTCWLGLAASFNIGYADVDLRNAIDGAITAAATGWDGGTAMGSADIFSRLTGDDWGYGAHFGVLVDPWDCLHLGFAYRTQLFHEVKGTNSLWIPDSLPQHQTNFALQPTGAVAAVKLPGRYTAGVTYDVNDCLSVMGEFQWTEWSKFKTLRVDLESVLDESITDEDWKDSWFGALGVRYQHNCCLAFRGGIAYDESPVPDHRRTPRIPDSDRFWVSTGFTYQPNNCWYIDASYSHIFVDDAKVNIVTTPGDNDQGRGNLSVDYESKIDILTLAIGFNF